MTSRKIKEISNYYWTDIEPNVDGYTDRLVNKKLKNEFNFSFDDELVLALIYEDNTNLKDYRNKKIYSMLLDNFTIEEIKKSLQAEYDRVITLPLLL